MECALCFFVRFTHYKVTLRYTFEVWVYSSALYSHVPALYNSRSSALYSRSPALYLDDAALYHTCICTIQCQLICTICSHSFLYSSALCALTPSYIHLHYMLSLLLIFICTLLCIQCQHLRNRADLRLNITSPQPRNPALYCAYKDVLNSESIVHTMNMLHSIVHTMPAPPQSRWPQTRHYCVRGPATPPWWHYHDKYSRVPKCDAAQQSSVPEIWPVACGRTPDGCSRRTSRIWREGGTGRTDRCLGRWRGHWSPVCVCVCVWVCVCVCVCIYEQIDV